MIKVNVRIDTRGFDRKINSLNAQRREQDATRSAFNAPVPFTQNAFFTKWARPNDLTATVMVKNQTGGRLSPTHWLFAQVEGGNRAQKAFMLVVLHSHHTNTHGKRLAMALQGHCNSYKQT
jgi:hypothetical protein